MAKQSTSGAEVATTKKGVVASFNIKQGGDTLDLAKDLAKFIKDNKLSTVVQGKDFVQVEGWQYAGGRLGIVPIVESVENISTEQELKYRAHVTLYDLHNDRKVGAGFAICSNKESGKKFYQEFAIASMAQTRAIGKAYRNILAWIIRAAGYEPTPAEEMDSHTTSATVVPGNSPATEPSVTPDVSSSAGPVVSDSAAQSGEQGAVQQPVQYATAAQKEEIIRLLNHPLITRQEKTKMLLNIQRLDEERAAQTVTKLRRAIEDRDGNSASIAA